MNGFVKMLKQGRRLLANIQRYPIYRLYRIRNIEFVFSLSVVRSPIVEAFSRHQTQETVLSGVLPLSISVKVALTTNICTNDGLANAAQGVLHQIVYNQDFIDYESSKGNDIILNKIPKYVIIELISHFPLTFLSLPFALLYILSLPHFFHDFFSQCLQL